MIQLKVEFLLGYDMEITVQWGELSSLVGGEESTSTGGGFSLVG